MYMLSGKFYINSFKSKEIGGNYVQNKLLSFSVIYELTQNEEDKMWISSTFSNTN
jgi:hypothetical protein